MTRRAAFASAYCLSAAMAISVDKVFPNWKDTLSFEHAWHRVVVKSGLLDLHFHDLRHEATTRLFERGLNPMQVAAITGIRRSRCSSAIRT